MTEEVTPVKDTSSNWPKIAMIFGMIVVIASLLLMLKWQHDQLQKQAELEKSVVEMKQLAHDIIRGQSKTVTQDDLEKLAKQAGIDLSTIRKNLDQLNAQVNGISTLFVTSSGSNQTNLPSTGSTPRPGDPTVVSCPGCDPFGYLTHAQILALQESFSDGRKIPFGEAEFKAWEEKPWGLKVYPRKYAVTTVLGVDENGKHYTYSTFTVTTNGQKYPVKIDESKFAEEKPEAKFRFSPRLYLGLDIGARVKPPNIEVNPNLQVALFSYGQTKVTPDWTFLGLGFGYATQSKELSLVVSPVNYNVAQHLPLVENLYVGPTVTLDTGGNVAVLGGIRVGM